MLRGMQGKIPNLVDYKKINACDISEKFTVTQTIIYLLINALFEIGKNLCSSVKQFTPIKTK